MIQYYLSALKKYADFSGRARRSEYWYFTLANAIIIYGTMIIAGLLANANFTAIGGMLAVLVSIYIMGILVPALALAVRRMHDNGKSGWFILIPIYNLILYVTEGQRGPNQYGEDPKAAERHAISGREQY